MSFATKTLSLATVALLATAAAATATSAHAATAATYNSNGMITYTPSTDVTKPVDPSNPGQIVTPENPDGSTPNPGTAGPLSIDFASSFDFGTQKITSQDATYTAAAQKLSDGTVRDNYVQVTDNRGTLAGWSLSVTATDFTTGGTGAGSTLTGAQITLGDGAIASASNTPADVSAATTTLTPGVASGTILGATAGNGAGTNLLNFGSTDGKTNADSAVTLFVPGATTKLASTYTSNLTWTLSDTPAQ